MVLFAVQRYVSQAVHEKYRTFGHKCEEDANVD